jgi:hypothetical protein
MRNPVFRYRSAPVATIAMVTYNSGRFVRDAIESALAQEFEDFELLICDDCSSDDTWEIVKSFSDRRIRAFRNERNLGEYRNRNYALSLARGRYLMYLDGDDILYRHGLAVMVDTMEMFPDAGYACALAPCEKFIYPLELSPREFCLAAYLGPGVLANDFTQLFFRTEALRRHGGLDLRYRSGDTQIQIQLGMREPVVLMSNGLAWWRRRRGQASEGIRSNGASIREMWRYCTEAIDDRACPLGDDEKAMARRNLTRLALRHSIRLLSRGQLRDAARTAFRTGFGLREWHCLANGYEHPFLREITGDDPIRKVITPAAASPPASPRVQRAVRTFVRKSASPRQPSSIMSSAVSNALSGPP